MANWKYHAELRFHDRKVRFTAVTLERLMARFTKEVAIEVARLKAIRNYSWIKPNLVVEVCSSWAEFNEYKHAT